MHFDLSCAPRGQSGRSLGPVEEEIILQPLDEMYLPWFDITTAVTLLARVEGKSDYSQPVQLNPPGHQQDAPDSEHVVPVTVNIVTSSKGSGPPVQFSFSAALGRSHSGTYQATFFTSYWIYNMTNLPLGVGMTSKTTVPLLLETVADLCPPLMVNADSMYVHSLPKYTQSNAIDLSNLEEAITVQLDAVVPDDVSVQAVSVTIDLSVPFGKLASRTKLIRIAPSIIFVNHLDCAIQFRQVDTSLNFLVPPATVSSVVKSGATTQHTPPTLLAMLHLARGSQLTSLAEHESDDENATHDASERSQSMAHTVGSRDVQSSDNALAFHWTVPSKDRLLTFRLYPGEQAAKSVQFHSTKDPQAKPAVQTRTTGWLWSGQFSIEESGEVILQAHHATTKRHALIQAQVLVEHGIKYVVFGAASTQYPPFRVENRTFTERIRVSQEDTSSWLIVQRYSALGMAYTNPLGSTRLAVDVMMNPSERKFNPSFTPVIIDIADPRAHSCITLHGPERQLYFYLETAGPTTTLIVSEFPQQRETPTQALWSDRLQRLTTKILEFSEQLSSTESALALAQERLHATGLDLKSGGGFNMRTSAGVFRTSASLFGSAKVEGVQLGAMGFLKIVVAEARGLWAVTGMNSMKFSHVYEAKQNRERLEVDLVISMMRFK